MLQQLSLRAKLTAAFCVTALFGVLASSFAIYYFAAKGARESAEQGLYDRVRDAESAVEIARASGAREGTNEAINEASLAALKSSLKAQRLLKTGYFYILDAKGTFVLHPAKEGQNVLNETDLDGKPLFKTILALTEGTLHYRWKNAETQKPQEKIAVCKAISSVGWHICASLNTTEVMERVHQLRVAAALVSAVTLALVALFAIAISSSLQAFIVGVAKRLLGTTVTLRATTKLVSESSATVSAATAQQVAAAQSTVSSVSEIKAMVERNAEHADRSKGEAQRAVDAALEGTQAVGELTKAIQDIVASNDRIQKQVEVMNNELGQIVSVIREIDTKTKVINDIVFQTKLLSFNASVEAARAGEHGKGFAVVAEEVGNLAQMSGKAALEISSMLEENIRRVDKIIEETRSSVGSLIQENRNIVQKGSVEAGRCNDAFGKMKEKVDTIQHLISEIALASQEQSQGVAEISRSMSELDIGLSTNARSANEVASLSTDLDRENKELTASSQELAWAILGAKRRDSLDEKAANVIDAALNAHAEWKNRLIRVINDTCKEVPDPKVACTDNQCALGKWIYQQGSEAFRKSPLFEELRIEHAKFHHIAGSVLTVALNPEQKVRARDLIAAGSDFDRQSAVVIGQLVSLKLSV